MTSGNNLVLNNSSGIMFGPLISIQPSTVMIVPGGPNIVKNAQKQESDFGFYFWLSGGSKRSHASGKRLFLFLILIILWRCGGFIAKECVSYF